jgi:hypothetical protein
VYGDKAYDNRRNFNIIDYLKAEPASITMSRDSEYVKQICNVCADICEASAKECERHTDMDHYQRCAQVCRRCAEECHKI